MKCEKCGMGMYVKDSRMVEDERRIIRTRCCPFCGEKVYTIEEKIPDNCGLIMLRAERRKRYQKMKVVL